MQKKKLRLIAHTSDRVGCDFSDKGIVNVLSLSLRFAFRCWILCLWGGLNMEHGDTEKYHPSRVLQDFVFLSRKRGCIRCIFAGI